MAFSLSSLQEGELNVHFSQHILKKKNVHPSSRKRNKTYSNDKDRKPHERPDSSLMVNIPKQSLHSLSSNLSVYDFNDTAAKNL